MGGDAINVEVCSIRELLRRPLQVPPYQRPYVWQASNVLQLIEDIEHSAQADPAPDESRYRIGTVIVYRNEDGTSLDIVDGQQRVITLHLILAVLGERKDGMRLDMRDDEQTRRHLYENDHAIRQLMDSWEGDRRSQFAGRLLDGCEVLKVTSGCLSEAFQMFDSQNARGKELDPTDLLKAFHLRRMDADGVDESRKQQLVRRWELLNHADDSPQGQDMSAAGIFGTDELPAVASEVRTRWNEYAEQAEHSGEGAQTLDCRRFRFRYRNSVEHFSPQHPLSGGDAPPNVNDFGNLCLLTVRENSRRNNLDAMEKIRHFNVAQQSLKFQFMVGQAQKETTWGEQQIKDQTELWIRLLDALSDASHVR